MALDSIILSALTEELSPILAGAKIDKIQQPERDKLLLSLRSSEGSVKLLIDAGAGSGRVQLTRLNFENPAEPPMFCMLLRKYLLGGRIERIEQPHFERLMIVYITSRNELGDAVPLRLACELMGRSANVVLVGADGRIIDCLRRMNFAGESGRSLLPGMIYRMPPEQKKPMIFSLPRDEVMRIISDNEQGKSADKLLMDSFSGLSPLICRELAFRCGDDLSMLPEAVSAFLDSVSAREFTPTLLLEDGKPRDFSFMNLLQYGADSETRVLSSFSELLDAYYSKRDLLERRRRRSRELHRTAKTAYERTSRKLENRRLELARCSERDNIRRDAELLTANLYRVKRGDRSVTVEDYYLPDCPPRTIRLDPLKTPQANAAAMFKEYNKLKTAERHLTELIAEGEKQLDWLGSVLDETDRAETEDDLAEIKAELAAAGYIKKSSGREKKHKKRGPMRFVSSDGFEILVGRSNAQNDELTCKTARRTDYWLHVKSVHGSHVVVSCLGEKPPERTLEEAASLAVYYSQGRGGGRTQVDCTMVRNVRKPSGAMPGNVIYTDYKTLFAEPDESLCEMLRKE